MNMDLVPLIEDLKLEINMLNDLKTDANNLTIEEKITEKNKIMSNIKSNLKKLSGQQICYRLYLHILSGMTPSQAVAKVSEENIINDIRPSSLTSIWKYYKELKKNIKL